MIDTYFITIKENGEVHAENYVLLADGENNSKRFVVSIPDKLSNKWIYVEFEKPSGDKSTSRRLIPTLQENRYVVEYDLSGAILDFSGFLCVQFIARDETGLVWKSDTKNFIVKYSINATNEVVENNSDFILDLQKQLDGKQDELIAGNNIELERKGEKVEIRVPIDSIGVSEEVVDTKIDNAVKSLMGGEVDEAYNSFKEIQELLKSDKVATEALIKKVNENSTEITKLKDSIADGAVNEEKVKEIVEDTIEEKALVSASEVDEKIDLTIGDINSILQTINGGIGAMLDEINGEVL